jgi:hypothetical protein
MSKGNWQEIFRRGGVDFNECSPGATVLNLADHYRKTDELSDG